MNCKAGFAIVAFMAIWALGTAAVADRLKDMSSNFTLDPLLSQENRIDIP